MTKFKVTIYKILIFLILLNGNALSKPLPPGSGAGDIPANILIMLDVSGSMGEIIFKGTAFKRPESIDVDPATGNVWGAQQSTDGIKEMQWSNGLADTTFGDNGTTDLNSWGEDCMTYFPREIK